MINYHCLTSYTTKTFSECVSDTTEIPDKKQLPSLYQADVVTHSAADLTEALQKPSPSSLTPNLGEKKTAVYSTRTYHKHYQLPPTQLTSVE